jgi:hypothetical protein
MGILDRLKNTLKLFLLLPVLALLVSLVSVYCVKLEPAMAQDTVVFHDPNLEKVIRAEDVIAGKEAITAPQITRADLEAITFLNGQAEHISDLSGLECCINLEGLDLSYNDIVDLTPLTGLTKLWRLNLSYNQINDIQALAGLHNLEELYLGNNNIDNIDILVNFPKLESIDLSRNNISDISVLSGLTHLEQVFLGHNNITDITPLFDNPHISSIDVIDLTDNPLNEKAYTEHLPELKNNVRLVFYDEYQDGELASQNGFPSYWWGVIGVVIAVLIIFIIFRRRRGR